MQPFEPLFRNPHLATIAGNFWPRKLDERRFPVRSVTYQTEPDMRVLVHEQRPEGDPKGELILVHGLEGSSDAGYARSLAQAALEAGFAVHRFNMRGCGGTDHLARTSYHSGQTSDLLWVIRDLRRRHSLPIVGVGFSLGGNVMLKLAGELGEQATGLLAGVCAISTPIDLAACVEQLERPANFLYEWRFVSRLKQRIRVRHKQAPETYTLAHLPRIHTVWEFDDFYTARLFRFGRASDYYRTQSSNQFLSNIRVPALVIQAKDDPLIPFRIYDHPAFAGNPHLRLLAVEHGGHLGFISRCWPRFGLDQTVLAWVDEVWNQTPADFVSS